MMFLHRVRFAVGAFPRRWVYRRSKRFKPAYDIRLPLNEVARRFPAPDEQWAYYHHFFWNMAPDWIREHRAFFATEARGFGEDALHAFWYVLLAELRPKAFLEIGVYRGQIISLVKLIAKREGFPCEVLGISPFTAVGDSVSEYGTYDYEDDVREHCRRFGTPLRQDELLRALSTDAVAEAAIRARRWDVAYIDGNHEYAVAREDFDVVSASLAGDGLVVLDDAGLYTLYHPKSFSFSGHPGPSRVLAEVVAVGWDIAGQAGHNVAVRRRLMAGS